MLRQCERTLMLMATALLAACATPAPAPPPAIPTAQAAPPEQPQLIERRAYWTGYAAGRRYQKQFDARLTPAPPAAVSIAQPAPVPAVRPSAVTPAAPPAMRPVPPPIDGYYANGPAQPVATPVN